MKKSILLSIFHFMVIMMMAQTQQGVAYRYNGKNPRTPLGNVTISYDDDKRSALSNENDGRFTLVLTGKEMGDRIGAVTVKKREMMVFNQHAVDEWSVRKEPLTLILCNTDEFERQKENLITIGKNQAKRKYELQKKELEKKLQEGKIELAEKEAALDNAYEELTRLQNNIGQYAELFARIDESEIDTLAQRAIELFKEGNVDDAIKLFEQGNYMEKLKQDNHQIQQLNEVMEVAQQAKESTEKLRQTHIQSIEAQIKAYQTQGEIEKAHVLYKALVDELNDMLYYMEYANFCHINEFYVEALSYYDKLQKAIEDSIAQNKYEYYSVQSIPLEMKAHIYLQTNNLDKLQETINTLIQQNRILVENPECLRHQSYPNEYQKKLAQNLVSMASHFYQSGDMGQTVKMLTEGVALSREIAIKDPSNINMEDYYEDLCYAGNILYDSKCYDEYEKMYLCAWNIENHIRGEKKYWERYKGEVATELGKLYIVIEQDEKAVKFLKEAIGIYKNEEDKLDNYLYTLYLLHHVAISYKEKYETGRLLLSLLDKRISDDSEVWKNEYEGTIGSQSFNAIFLKKYEEAEQLAKKGLEMNPTKHWIATNLAAALLFQGKYTEAEEVYLQYKDELKSDFLDDFKHFSEAGVIPKKCKMDVEKIKKLLDE